MVPQFGAEAAGGGEDEPGGGVGGLVLPGWQDAGVGVGGEHDAGVAELVLDGFEVGAGAVGEAGGAVSQVVQPHGWQVVSLDEQVKSLGEVVRLQR